MTMTRIARWLIAAALLGGAATAQSPEQQLKALIDRYNKEFSAVREAYGKASTDEERNKIWAGRPGKGYIPEFRALAQGARGTDTAAQAWMWVLRLNETDMKQDLEVIEVLLSEHMSAPAMEELAGVLRSGSYEYGETRVIEGLRSIVAESPHERARAAALFGLGTVQLGSKEAERQAEGRDCLEAVIAEYGTLTQRGETTYKDAAAGYLYELDRLQIGMVAPDFESIDENGAKWKLSDYRGKVVVVDFWGNW